MMPLFMPPRPELFTTISCNQLNLNRKLIQQVWCNFKLQSISLRDFISFEIQDNSVVFSTLLVDLLNFLTSQLREDKRSASARKRPCHSHQ